MTRLNQGLRCDVGVIIAKALGTRLYKTLLFERCSKLIELRIAGATCNYAQFRLGLLLHNLSIKINFCKIKSLCQNMLYVSKKSVKTVQHIGLSKV